MKKYSVLAFVLMFLIGGCSVGEDEPMYQSPNNSNHQPQLQARIAGSEEDAFTVINELGLFVKSIYIYDGFTTLRKDLSLDQLKRMEPELEKKPYIEEVIMFSKNVITIDLQLMHQKNYQREWRVLKEDLKLFNNGQEIDVIFVVPHGSEKRNIELLESFPQVKEVTQPQIPGGVVRK